MAPKLIVNTDTDNGLPPNCHQVTKFYEIWIENIDENVACNMAAICSGPSVLMSYHDEEMGVGMNDVITVYKRT